MQSLNTINIMSNFTDNYIDNNYNKISIKKNEYELFNKDITTKLKNVKVDLEDLIKNIFLLSFNSKIHNKILLNILQKYWSFKTSSCIVNKLKDYESFFKTYEYLINYNIKSNEYFNIYCNSNVITNLKILILKKINNKFNNIIINKDAYSKNTLENYNYKEYINKYFNNIDNLNNFIFNKNSSIYFYNNTDIDNIYYYISTINVIFFFILYCDNIKFNNNFKLIILFSILKYDNSIILKKNKDFRTILKFYIMFELFFQDIQFNNELYNRYNILTNNNFKQKTDLNKNINIENDNSITTNSKQIIDLLNLLENNVFIYKQNLLTLIIDLFIYHGCDNKETLLDLFLDKLINNYTINNTCFNNYNYAYSKNLSLKNILESNQIKHIFLNSNNIIKDFNSFIFLYTKGNNCKYQNINCIFDAIIDNIENNYSNIQNDDSLNLDNMLDILEISNFKELNSLYTKNACSSYSKLLANIIYTISKRIYFYIANNISIKNNLILNNIKSDNSSCCNMFNSFKNDNYINNSRNEIEILYSNNQLVYTELKKNSNMSKTISINESSFQSSKEYSNNETSRNYINSHFNNNKNNNYINNLLSKKH